MLKKNVDAYLKMFLSVLFISIAMNANAATVTHYSIDFSSPTNTVGSPPATGNSPYKVSRINFGNPIVAASFGPLTNQPLVFTADVPGGYDQIQLNLGRGYDNYHVSFDMASTNLVGSLYAFYVSLDTPTVQTIDFHGGIGVSTYNSSHVQSLYGNVGSFSDNTLTHVNIDVDLRTSLWTLNIGSLPTFTSTFFAEDNDVNAIRFNLSAWGGNSPANPSVQVGLDNILVTSTAVPAPGAMWLTASGLFGLLGISRYKSRH